jgi:catechol 2,3-dioxygenase-like lactoylglutathione lyase family enzyme
MLNTAYEALRDKVRDIDPPRTAPYGMKQLYVRDPDGYEICFQWPA